MTISVGTLQRTNFEEVRHSRPVILNLGCGTKTSDLCVNVDWSIYIILRQNLWALPLATPMIGRDRVERIKAMQGVMVRHNLGKGIPFPEGFADAVYHSHVMEHIPRESVLDFQKDILRVLKPGGIQRLCLPDLEQLVLEYARSLAADDSTDVASRRHDDAVSLMFEQCVREAPAGTRGKTGLRLWCENLLLGDARARGELHRWMWDRLNIRAVLSDAGFTDIHVRDWNTSDINGWKETELEQTSDGREYKPQSLYIECKRPA